MSQTLKFGNGTWATKKGSTLAYSDEGGNFKPLPFTYTGFGKGTRVNKEGLIEVVENDRPRIDYLDSEDGVFLLEKAATNLIQYSEAFNETYWNKSNTNVVSGQLSPKGDTSAFKLLNSAVTSTHYLNRSSISVASGVDYTFSILAKKGGNDFITVMLQGTGWLGSSKQVSFNLANGTFDYADTGLTYKSTLLSSGFYRIEVTNETASTSVNLRVYTSATVNNTSSYLGDGTSGVYIFGAMLEQNSVASSYIPTQGTIQTRVQETASGSGSSGAFNDSQGVLFANIAANADDGTSRRISLSNGGASQRISLELDEVSNNVRMLVVSNTFQVDIGANLPDATNYNKIVLKYKENDFSIWTNGYEVATTNSGLTPSSLSTLGFDASVSSSFFYGKTKEISYYDEILTDEELEYMTSYRTWEEMVKELNLNIIHNE